MDKLQFRITEVAKQKNDIVLLTLEPVDCVKPSYFTGQFLSLIFNIGGKEVRRSYSILSSPAIDEPIQLAIKRVENGELSSFLHHKVRVGDVVTSLYPNGMFTYSPIADKERTIFLFAAGVGITPLFSILKTALTTETHSKIILTYSNRSVSSALFYEELKEWEAKYPDRLKVIFLFSESQNLMMARLNSMLIQDIVKKQLSYNKEDALFYTCGPMNYMDVCRMTLLGMGFDKTQVRRETFFIEEDEGDEDDNTEKLVKDTNTYKVKIDYHGTVHEIEVPYYKSILDVALEQHIELPYSCKGGVCSTCMATCTNGGVRLDYNEVLTDEDIRKGKILVCVGHPTQENTTIVY